MARRAMLIVAAVLSLGALATEPGVTVEEAWVREVPPGRDMSAGFLMLTNQTDDTIALVRVETEAARSVELHSTRHEDGMMSMQRVLAYTLEPQSTHRLAPGGDHLMLIGLRESPARGDSIALTLHFSDGSSLQVSAEVRAN